MPMKFEYDPKGDIFTYYMCSFGALVLVPGKLMKYHNALFI